MVRVTSRPKSALLLAGVLSVTISNDATAFTTNLPSTSAPATNDVSGRRFASTLPSTETETDTTTPTEDAESPTSSSVSSSLQSSGAVAAAAMATAAVNAAVSMKTLSAPDENQKSYVSLDNGGDGEPTELDVDGLPLSYDRVAIENFWRKERGALNQRWSYFVGKAVPFLTRLVTLFIREGEIAEKHVPELSRQARLDLEDLGPTFIKARQMMSVRPDVLPQSTLDELVKLQDAVVPFDTAVAVRQIERELGAPLGTHFTSISEEPVAAASLAQVYLATLNDGEDTRVAVKVQRPDVLATVSKDLYVLRRAAEVFQGLVERFAPQQKTDYVALLNEWAIGFYTELDFQNEAANQRRLRADLLANGVKGVTVPRTYDHLCTRRVLVSEWMDGVKLGQCAPEVIANVTVVAQEAFLTQLFETGFFHADPHPGNLLLLDEPTPEGDVVALIDCGLMANIDATDRDRMISAVIHLANKDYASLVDDFMELNILPRDSDRRTIIPLMDKALSPYVKGGGAKRYEEEVRRMYGMEDGAELSDQVGGFQAMTQDALTVLQDVPFSIPPYFAILGRAIVTLEGVALTGNPNYGIIMESYPFIARKLLREDRPEIQRALQEVLFNKDDGSGFKVSRLLALLHNAAGDVGTQEAGGAFVDLDAVPEDGSLTFADALKYLLSDRADSLRTLLEKEVDVVVDLLARQSLRRGAEELLRGPTLPSPPSLPFVGNVLSRFVPTPPRLDDVRLPILLPATHGDASTTTTPTVGLLTPTEFLDKVAPRLDRDEELYALSLADAADEVCGSDVGALVRGESLLELDTARLVLNTLRRTSTTTEEEDAVARTIRTVLSALGAALGGATNGDDDVDLSTSSFDNTLGEALDQLSDKERERFDEITEEIVRRSVDRARERLADVPRVFG